MARLAFIDVTLSIFVIFTIVIISFPLLSQAISSRNGGCCDLNTARASSSVSTAGATTTPISEPEFANEPHPPLLAAVAEEEAVTSTVLSLATAGPTLPTGALPPVTSSTKAKLTNYDFSAGGDGGGPSECDDRYHDNSELIVALSTGLHEDDKDHGSEWEGCDECDSMKGCDEEQAYQPPCRNNIIDGSDAVWSALGLDKNVGVVDVTWSMA